MKAMKAIIAILAVVMLGLVYWSYLQAEIITKTKEKLEYIRQVLGKAEKKNRKFYDLYEKQAEELIKYRIKNKKTNIKWAGPGWYIKRVRAWEWYTSFQNPSSLCFDKIGYSYEKENPFKKTTSHGWYVKWQDCLDGPYPTKEKCLAAMN